MVPMPISDLHMQVSNSRTAKHVKWEWTQDAELGFRKLNTAFNDPSTPVHFNPVKQRIVQPDASGFAMVGIVFHYDHFGILRPVNSYSRQCTGDEQNYDTYAREH
jgi:hypothetical protein